MRSSKFSDTQIIAILKQNEDGILAPDLCREHGMSNAAFYKWRAKFVGNPKSEPADTVDNVSLKSSSPNELSRTKTPKNFFYIGTGLFLIVISSNAILNAIKYKAVASRSGSYSLADNPTSFYFQIGLYVFFLVIAGVVIFREWSKNKD